MDRLTNSDLVFFEAHSPLYSGKGLVVFLDPCKYALSPKIRKEVGIVTGPTTSRHSARMLTELIKVQLNLIAHVHSYLIASIGIPHIPLLCLLVSRFPDHTFISPSKFSCTEGLGTRLGSGWYILSCGRRHE